MVKIGWLAVGKKNTYAPIISQLERNLDYNGSVRSAIDCEETTVMIPV